MSPERRSLGRQGAATLARLCRCRRVASGSAAIRALMPRDVACAGLLADEDLVKVIVLEGPRVPTVSRSQLQESSI
jgi:hypothetical protein